MSITHDIYKSFDCGYEVRSIFLDISKAFDKVWHDGIIFKLEQNGISGKLHKLLHDFLVNRKQRVVLNGQVSSWSNVEAVVPQGSILGPLFFPIYINDLPKGLSSNAKLFADDTSLFAVIHDSNATRNELNDDLVKISNGAYQWKMSFNPDPNKQAQEVIFSRKIKKLNHPPLTFSKSTVSQSTYQKHLGVILDASLSFNEHLITVQSKTNKTVGLLRKLQNTLPRQALITIYKAFIRPHLDYGDILYDQAYNASFHQKLEKIQYNACIAITGGIRGTSKEKIYRELGLESLESRRWFRKLCFFFKILKNKSPDYLFKIIPQRRSSYITRNSDEIPLFKTNHNFYKNSFFPSTTIEWNNLDHDLRNTESYTLFRSSILKFIRPSPNSSYGGQNIMGIKLITRLCLGHLREHKFRHSFQDTLNPLCNCGMDVEFSTHFLLQCLSYINERCTLMSNLNRINPQISQTSLQLLTNTLLFRNSSYSDKTNTHILNATIDYIQLTKRFDEQLF